METQEWAAANPRSNAHWRRASRVLPGGVTHDVRRAVPFPLAVARAEGARKWDLDGHEIICYVMGHGALLLGHSDPGVVAAVRHQATVAFHPGASHELETEWAEAVVDLVPSAEIVRFTASGTEATLLGLRLARAATGRERIVKLAGHFHGWHDQVSFGTDPPFHGPDTAGIPAALGRAVTVVPADAAALEEALAGGDVAAVILEPSAAANLNVAAPIEASAAANVASPDAQAVSEAYQHGSISQGITGDATATAPQHASVAQDSSSAFGSGTTGTTGGTPSGTTVGGADSLLNGGSLLDANVNLHADANLAAPIDGAVAAQGNVAAPVDAAVAANVASPGAAAEALAPQQVDIHQNIDGNVQATAEQTADVNQK